MNSRAKGKRGELEWAEWLRAHGVEARRGVQFRGGGDSPDVVTDLPVHFEVKRREALNVSKAMRQAVRDAAPGRVPIVAHRRNGEPWLVTLRAEDWIVALRGSTQPAPPS